MKVIVVDDERIILTTETKKITKVLKNATVTPFQNARDAVAYAEQNKVDIAFLDINMHGMTGLELAEKLSAFNPKVNIIFCTGYSEYSLDALDLYCSAYLMKPVTEDSILKAISKLRYPVEETKKLIKVQCFGNFDVFKDGQPVKFKFTKTKELFAYLIDRNGATVSTKEMIVALFEDDDKASYVRNLRADLKEVFESLSVDDVLVYEGNNMGVNKEKIDCDYYDYLSGNKWLFQGEYMSQYNFGEETLGRLLKENK